MLSPASLSKTVAQASLWVGAIAGSLLVATFHPVSATPQIQSSGQTAPSAEVNPEAVLAIALGGSAAIGLGLSALVDRNRKHPSQTDRVESVSFDRISRPLQQKLIRELHGDRSAAMRLFTQASFKTPGKPSNWYAEKVIYDLERDRGR